MKVIFLDFDGVITSVKSKWNLDPEKMDLIKYICDSTGAKIVISSSWRKYDLESTIKHITTESLFTGHGVFSIPELVVGITPRFDYFYDSEDKYIHIPKGVEIEHYLNRYSDIDTYVILDDDSDILLNQADFFIQTNPYTGITKEEAERAIKILND